MFPTNRAVMQQAWVVNDLEAAARRWSATMGIGPFYLTTFTPDRFQDIIYRGAPGVHEMRTAISYSGDIQIELIERTGKHANCYSDSIAPGQEGFHHLCLWTTDLEADILGYAAQGLEVATRGRLKRGPAFAYIDAVESIGCMIELLEFSQKLSEVFAQWRDNCAAWRGGDLFIGK
jgi:hypothetical protein